VGGEEARHLPTGRQKISNVWQDGDYRKQSFSKSLLARLAQEVVTLSGERVWSPCELNLLDRRKRFPFES
jgi:hypothetical protein